MARQKRTYSQEYRDEAVKLVIETSRPISVVARELGLLEGTLGNWVSAYRKSHPVEEQPLAMPDRARLKELERENREWVALADSVVRSALDRAALPTPAGSDGIDLGAIARHHDVDAAELYRTVRRGIEQLVLRDAEMSHEFRVAMLRLCQERLGRGDVTVTERETVLGWLHGERLPAADLRRVGLNAKVNRYNARPLLLSTTRWLRIAGRSGLVLRLDLDRLAVTRRPPAGLRDGYYYAKAATLDAYELVRQMIDAIDETAGLFVAVQVPPALVHDEARGLPAYTALQLRVADEVRDRHRPNPYAALVRVGSTEKVS